jgi:hypothetical protein
MRQGLLDGELRLAVRIDRRRGVMLPQRRFCRLAIGRARRREHEPPAALGHHRFERAQRADDVVAVVPDRIADGVGHREPRREMHHCAGAALPNRPPDGVHIGDVTHDERRAKRRFAVAGRKIVVDDRVIPGGPQRLDRVTADVAGAPGDEHRPRINRGQWSNTRTRSVSSRRV